jgi:hypothetical protein
MRQIIFVIIPFLLPSLIYLLWWLRARRKAIDAGQPEQVPGLGDAPTTLLLGVGVSFVALMIFGFLLSGDGQPGDTYVPPHTVDGIIQPGYFEPKK